jgi:hypothetical protein
MRLRLTSAAVLLLYATMALIVGMLHEHAHDGGQSHPNCVACSWQLSGTADVPAANVEAVTDRAISPIPATPAGFIAEVSFLLCFSRAPPAA